MRLASLLLIAATVAAPAAVLAQAPRRQAVSLSFGYSSTRTNSNAGQCGCFWLNGGSGELALPLGRHVSAVADFGGSTTSSVNGGAMGLSLLTYTAGPRLSLPRTPLPSLRSSPRWRRTRLQLLLPGRHGFQLRQCLRSARRRWPRPASLPAPPPSAWPRPTTLMTRLPNGSNNSQNNLRLTSAIVFTFHGEER